MYISKARLPSLPVGTLTIAPDIAFEVVSPTDEAETLDTKIGEYFSAGVRLVWVLYPQTKSVYVYRPGELPARLGPDGTLSGEDVLPGFSVPVRDLFPAD